MITEIETKKILVGHSFETLFERLVSYKKHFKSSFNFEVNESETIALACILPSAYIFNIFMIKAKNKLESEEIVALEVVSDISMEDIESELESLETMKAS